MKPLITKLLPIIVAQLLGYIPLIQAQTETTSIQVQGVILYKNGKPAETAIIAVKETGKHTFTNEKGEFSLTQIQPSTSYTLEIRTFNNKVETFTHTFQRTNNKPFVIRLKTNPGINLREVIVKGKSQGRQIKEKGFALEEINTQKAALQSLQTSELLARSAGVQVRQAAGMGSNTTFNINGLTGNAVRIFIDGVPAQNYGRTFSISNIPPALIERIEIYKGVLPIELSQDALGGGINIILKKDIKNKLSTSYSYGSFNTHQWDMHGTYFEKKTKINLSVSAFLNHSDNNYKVWGDNVYITNNTTGEKSYITARRFHDDFHSYGIRTSIGVTKRKWADELTVGLMYSKLNKDIQTGATMQVVYGNRNTHSKNRMANIKYQKRNILPNIDINTYTTFSKDERHVTDTISLIYNWLGDVPLRADGTPARWNRGGGEAGAATSATNYENTIANRSNLRYQITPNQHIGASYFINYFSRKIDDTKLPQQAREALDKRKYQKQILGINYENSLLNGRLRTNIFYKIYSQRVRLTEVTSRLANSIWNTEIKKHDRSINDKGYGITSSFAISPIMMVQLSAERAIRLPGSTELLGNTSENITPGYTLIPENSRNLNLGLIIGEIQHHQHFLNIEINLFLRDIRDMIVQAAPKNTDDFYNFENLGKVISKGIDADIKYSLQNNLYWNTTLSYIDARFNLEYNEQGIKYLQYRSRLRNLPYFTCNSNIEYNFREIIQKNSRLTANYNLAYTRQFFRDWENFGSANKVTIPTQVVHDIACTYQFPGQKISLSFNAKNIFNRQVFDNYALQKPGRAFFGKITYTIF